MRARYSFNAVDEELVTASNSIEEQAQHFLMNQLEIFYLLLLVNLSVPRCTDLMLFMGILPGIRC